jgi:hypothetical protein
MDPDNDGPLFNESIEQGITSLVDRVHYTTGGAFGENGHSIIIAECVKCGDLYGKIRQALAKEIL